MIKLRLSDFVFRKRCRYDEHPKPRPANNCIKIFKLHSLFSIFGAIADGCVCVWVGKTSVCMEEVRALLQYKMLHTQNKEKEKEELEYSVGDKVMSYKRCIGTGVET